MISDNEIDVIKARYGISALGKHCIDHDRYEYMQEPVIQ